MLGSPTLGSRTPEKLIQGMRTTETATLAEVTLETQTVHRTLQVAEVEPEQTATPNSLALVELLVLVRDLQMDQALGVQLTQFVWVKMGIAT